MEGAGMGYKNAKEFMKIRAELFCQMSKQKSPRKSLPSLRKLAEEFSVSHPTAMRAVHSLIEDGFLAVGKKGGYKSLLDSGGQPKMQIYGLVNGSGDHSFEFITHWALNIPLVRNILSRRSRICTKNIFLDKPENLHTAIYENGLSGIILSCPNKTMGELARKVKNRMDIPIVAFYSPTRSISSSGPGKDVFYSLFRKMAEEGRWKILLILSRNHIFHADIMAVTEQAKFMYGLETVMLSGSEREILASLKKLYAGKNHFDGVIFFSTIDTIYDFIRSREDTDEKCRLTIDQFELYREMNYTGYLYRLDLESAAEKIIDNLLEQRTDSEKKVFVPMTVSFEMYRNGKKLNNQEERNREI